MKPLTLLGKPFGRLTVIERVANNKFGQSMWCCQCACNGNTDTVTSGSHLKSGHTYSCGCLQKESVIKMSTKHGMSHSRTYKVWCNMIARCKNPKTAYYHNYGGRGVKVCDRWMESFENFFEDVGEAPPRLTIERKENNGNYEPGNVCWATRTTQMRNTRVNRWIRFREKKKTLQEWSEQFGLSQSLVHWRLKQGWSIEDALTRPVRPMKFD